MKLVVAAMAVLLAFGRVSTARADAPSCAVGADDEGVSRGPSSVKEPSNGVTVIQVDPSFPIEKFKNSGYIVKSSEQFYAGDPWQDPDQRLRDRLFREAGIDRFVQGLDGLGRDLLFLRAQEQSVETLARKYPKVPKQKLGSLRQLIAGEKRAAR